MLSKEVSLLEAINWADFLTGQIDFLFLLDDLPSFLGHDLICVSLALNHITRLDSATPLPVEHRLLFSCAGFILNSYVYKGKLLPVFYDLGCDYRVEMIVYLQLQGVPDYDYIQSNY